MVAQGARGKVALWEILEAITVQNKGAVVGYPGRDQNKTNVALNVAGGGFGVGQGLGHTDGELESGLAQRAQLAQVIRDLRPDVVLGHDPWKRYRLHPDHRNAGLLVTEGIVAARDPKFFPDQPFAHHRPDRLLLWEADEPDHAENTTGWFDAKYAALMAHESQFESTMKSGDDPGLERFRQRVLAKLTVAGAAAGMPEAEIFKLIDD